MWGLWDLHSHSRKQSWEVFLLPQPGGFGEFWTCFSYSKKENNSQLEDPPPVGDSLCFSGNQNPTQEDAGGSKQDRDPGINHKTKNLAQKPHQTLLFWKYPLIHQFQLCPHPQHPSEHGTRSQGDPEQDFFPGKTQSPRTGGGEPAEGE